MRVLKQAGGSVAKLVHGNQTFDALPLPLTQLFWTVKGGRQEAQCRIWLNPRRGRLRQRRLKNDFISVLPCREERVSAFGLKTLS